MFFSSDKNLNPSGLRDLNTYSPKRHRLSTTWYINIQILKSITFSTIYFQLNHDVLCFRANISMV